MNTNSNLDKALAGSLDSLRRQLSALDDRIAAIERSIVPASDEAAASSARALLNDARRAPDELTPEIVAVISAALAAFLGVKARIRQISVVGGDSWAHQGRMTIQASHALTIQRE